ncbi:unnamed protein product (macronuclear) [Paramecium tetraurelia]|uniref:RING-type domain-containing protein n=1 Tax=Paramecium tetraurelia TaxID=5888 RepID=A0BUM8_PARTE|nr:uncharacterized protein GSPATT00005491001 [Paramecium tetraurelia]CAK62245.1 unnamed protein product [Paramecium tetraurelia]|eukprot:XP_001429643.1 hypothetical protein (macronuclear) [Paramecium tetraurelia strain d4-2]
MGLELKIKFQLLREVGKKKKPKHKFWDEKKQEIRPFVFHILRKMKKIDFLPFFAQGCVDSWLATKGSCPLCKKYVRSLVQQFS